MAGTDRGPFTAGVASSLNLPPPAVLRHDIGRLQENRRHCATVVRAYEGQIAAQHEEQKELRALAANPGIYDADCCEAAANRCNEHVRMFEATIAKERAKITQLDSIIATLERRLCLSEQMSR